MDRNEQYPASPKVDWDAPDRLEQQDRRLGWFTARNKALQEGARRVPASGTFGKGVPDRAK